MNDDQYNCDHAWQRKYVEGTARDGTSYCHKCDLVLTNSNRLQLEMNRHNLGLQKKLQIITAAVSLVALLISIYAAIC